MFNFNGILPDEEERQLPPDQLPWTPSGMQDPRLMQASYSSNPPTPQMLASQLQPNAPMQSQQVDPQYAYINDVLGQYGQNKQKQQDTGGLIAQMLSQRIPTTANDVSHSLLNSSLNNTYSSPEEQALEPYTKMAELQTKLSALKNRGGATGELIDRLMQENPGMSFQQALQRVQTGYRSGTQMDAQGNIVNLPGAVQSAANMSGGKKSAEENAVLNYAEPIAVAKAQGEVAGKGEITPMQNLNKGQGQVSDLINNIKGYYTNLDAAGGAVNSNNNAFTNTGAYLSNTLMGQGVGKAFGTANQNIRNNIEQSRPLLINAIRQATGMSAKAMDSNAELNFYLKAATDPTLDVKSNLLALDKLEELYGMSSKKFMDNTAGGIQLPGSANDQSSGATHTYNPATGQLQELR